MNHFVSSPELARTEAGTFVDENGRALKSVLFVCWGNVCRSKAGEAVFRRQLKSCNLESQVYIDSAGVSVDERPPRPSMSMMWAAFRRGYVLRNRVRHITRPDLETFDLVIAMDVQNLNALRSLHNNPKSRIYLLSDFLPVGSPRDVPDPMHRPVEICHQVFNMLEQACPRIASKLLGQGHGAQILAATHNRRPSLVEQSTRWFHRTSESLTKKLRGGFRA